MARTIPPPPRVLISLEEGGDRLGGISARTVRRLIADGSLTGYRVSRAALRVDMAEVDALAARVVPTVGTK